MNRTRLHLYPRRTHVRTLRIGHRVSPDGKLEGTGLGAYRQAECVRVRHRNAVLSESAERIVILISEENFSLHLSLDLNATIGTRLRSQALAAAVHEIEEECEPGF